MTSLICGACTGVCLAAIFSAIDLPIRALLLAQAFPGAKKRLPEGGFMVRAIPFLCAAGAALGAYAMLTPNSYRFSLPAGLVLLNMGVFFGMFTACLSELLDVSTRLFDALPKKVFACMGLLMALGKTFFLYFALRGML